MELIKMKLSEIIPYEKNPRKNDNAVKDVAESIDEFGYITPMIVDENNVLLAGHTRLKALKKLGVKEAEVIVERYLTEEQKKKYRILDNKISELTEWDFDMLETECEDLSFDNYDFSMEFSNNEAKEKAPNSEEVEKTFTSPNVSVEISDDEIIKLEEMLKRYIKIYNSVLGFFAWVCEEKENAQDNETTYYS